jgi:hypothetical protein
MKKITIRYGIESITKEVSCSMTVGQVKTNPTFSAALGYGNNVDALINGVSVPNEAIVPDGATVVIETACNSKAQS